MGGSGGRPRTHRYSFLLRLFQPECELSEPTGDCRCWSSKRGPTMILPDDHQDSGGNAGVHDSIASVSHPRLCINLLRVLR